MFPGPALLKTSSRQKTPNWSHQPHTTEMQRVRPAIEAGLIQSAKAVALYMRLVLETVQSLPQLHRPHFSCMIFQFTQSPENPA
jgi:hypothetical protein